MKIGTPFANSFVSVDPPLGVDDDTAHRLQIDAEPVLTIVTVFVTSNYNNLLAAEVTDDADAMD